MGAMLIHKNYNLIMSNNAVNDGIILTIQHLFCEQIKPSKSDKQNRNLKSFHEEVRLSLKPFPKW